MRGLCLGSIIDREYKLVETLSGGRRMFYGPSGWSIEWQKNQSFWQLSNDRIPGKTICEKIYFKACQLKQAVI